MPKFNQSNLQVRQSVYSSLYGGRHGIICKITGDQQPGTISSLLGVAVTGGNAYIDVVFDNGTLSSHIPEAIIRGVQWTIQDEVVDQETLDALLSHHETVSRLAEQDRHDKEVRQNIEREKLRQDFPYLKPVNNDVRHSRTGAANLRTELKHAFPTVKFSVRMSGGSAIDINWTDGPTTEQVEVISGKYQAGNFNGMEDKYERNSDNLWPDVFGGDRYVFTHRDYSDYLVQIAIDNDYVEYAINYKSANIDKPSVVDFRNGRLHTVCDPLRHSNGNSIQSDIHERLAEYSEIEAIKPTNDVPEVKVITDDTDYSVREGTKPGFVEIIFNDKPGDDVRTRLKDSGFRWSPRNSVWFGRQDRLPDQFCTSVS